MQGAIFNFIQAAQFQDRVHVYYSIRTSILLKGKVQYTLMQIYIIHRLLKLHYGLFYMHSFQTARWQDGGSNTPSI